MEQPPTLFSLLTVDQKERVKLELKDAVARLGLTQHQIGPLPLHVFRTGAELKEALGYTSAIIDQVPRPTVIIYAPRGHGMTFCNELLRDYQARDLLVAPLLEVKTKTVLDKRFNQRHPPNPPRNPFTAPKKPR